ncbi:MAG: hypothetical protein KDG89_10340 [Geminicoccaceae bacterium]|nr:hypothetical protein [Geminicoccaceae bacterium]
MTRNDATTTQPTQRVSMERIMAEARHQRNLYIAGLLRRLFARRPRPAIEMAGFAA